MLNLSYVNQVNSQVHSNANQTHFNMIGFALGLVLKQRQKATGKWPIVSSPTKAQLFELFMDMPLSAFVLKSSNKPAASVLSRPLKSLAFGSI